jgi:hypothetical protein
MPRGSELLFQILTEREEKASVAVASNLPFSEWGQIIPDPRLVAAIVDRVTLNRPHHRDRHRELPVAHDQEPRSQEERLSAASAAPSPHRGSRSSLSGPLCVWFSGHPCMIKGGARSRKQGGASPA